MDLKTLGVEEKLELVESGVNEYLDYFVNDRSVDVRIAVALKGQDRHLDILRNDKNSSVRRVVATYGRDEDLDILVHDKDLGVRSEVVEVAGVKHLKVLAKDVNVGIRCRIVEFRIPELFEIFKRDTNLDVQEVFKEVYANRLLEVTGKAYTILNSSDATYEVGDFMAREDALEGRLGETLDEASRGFWQINDVVLGFSTIYEIEYKYVKGKDKFSTAHSFKVLRKVSPKDYELDATSYVNARFCLLNPTDEGLDVFVHSPYQAIQEEIVKIGRPKDLKVLLHSKYTDIVKKVLEKIDNKEIGSKEFKVLEQRLDLGILIKLAEFGNDIVLDKLFYDESPFVRGAVAKRGRQKDLDILVYDKAPHVRACVAEAGTDKELDILVNDREIEVRAAVAARGIDKYLDLLQKSRSPIIQKEIVKFRREQDYPYLVRSSAKEVGCIIAETGEDKYLDILVNHKHPHVLVEVLKHRRPQDIKKLLHHDAFLVQYELCQTKLPEVLDVLRFSRYENIRVEVAKIGRPEDLDILVKDSYAVVVLEVLKHRRLEDMLYVAKSSKKLEVIVKGIFCVDKVGEQGKYTDISLEVLKVLKTRKSGALMKVLDEYCERLGFSI